MRPERLNERIWRTSGAARRVAYGGFLPIANPVLDYADIIRIIGSKIEEQVMKVARSTKMDRFMHESVQRVNRRMEELSAGGMDRSEAARQAMQEIVAEVKARRMERAARRNARP